MALILIESMIIDAKSHSIKLIGRLTCNFLTFVKNFIKTDSNLTDYNIQQCKTQKELRNDCSAIYWIAV